MSEREPSENAAFPAEIDLRGAGLFTYHVDEKTMADAERVSLVIRFPDGRERITTLPPCRRVLLIAEPMNAP